MNFEKFYTWFPLLMWIRFEQVLKLTNLTNRMNNQNHVRVVKIRPESKKMNMASYDEIFMQDHEETCFNRFQDVIHEIRVKMCFCNPRWKSVSHRVRWNRMFWSWWKSDLNWENKWEVWVFIVKIFFLTWQTWIEWKILKNQSKSSLLSKISSKLSLLGSSHSLQR